MTIGEEM
jgi:hypothetical protein